MIKYIGSKRALLGHVTGAVAGLLPDRGRVCDLFSGTARVGHALKRQGFEVWSNDHNAYAHTLATAYVQADRDRWLAPAEAVLAELREVRPQAGWFTQAFCEDARYFHPDNGARIDAMRERIETLSLEPELKAVALVSLMEAADRVDSTAGVQMAYMKRWAPRALKPLELRLPDILPSVGAPCRATRGDAIEMAAEVEADLVYLDPPYNQHSYLANYHVWESLVLWDRPETYGVANKRIDVKTRKSAFNSRPGIGPALRAVIERVRAPNLIVSFNDEGYLSRADLVEMLSARGHVQVVEIAHPRYVGARIGIHNPKGEKVGQVGRLRNVEHLFVVTDRPVALPAAA
ncbi:MAG: DNA methyltransferase [Brevundimonas sp.]|uniref:site-specific DNA-methyltransferase (adenine-specific) n=1 Tax=Brevundimonas albigilva TaxID=1312364 RepID=A0ABY4SPI6_9CAUL|nr:MULTISPECIES: DNA adenine methylase [Brevundimonas]PZU61696.1 MAG: DNA methyltransferase [Brevundimonas sp.]UQV19102.1 DNA adenine methylase [Brevundimonas albigilva]URI16035.1 DNA adenine methylase [Brevundimonas albigilva]